MLLNKKTVLITGASRGIGSGIAQAFAKAGANIAFTYSSSAGPAEALENELSALGIKAKAYQSNAADFEAAQQLAADVVETFGSIDVLINNAGITKDNLLMRITEEDFVDSELTKVFSMDDVDTDLTINPLNSDDYLVKRITVGIAFLLGGC